MNVTSLLLKEKGESTKCTGLDEECSRRIRNKPAYPLLMLLGNIILDMFGILLVVCNHGKHRSVAVAKNIAQERSGVFLAPCSKALGYGYYMSSKDFIQRIERYMVAHISKNGEVEFPIISVGSCGIAWEGNDWANEHNVDKEEYHSPAKDDIIVELLPPSNAGGWMYATLFWATQYDTRRGCLPPTCRTSDYTYKKVCPSSDVMKCIRDRMSIGDKRLQDHQ